MEPRKRGKIINIASTAGKWASPNQAAYNSSKHALVGLTRCVALEAAASGIMVNAICPGFVDTKMMTDLPTTAAALNDVSVEQFTSAAMGSCCNASSCDHGRSRGARDLSRIA